MSFYNTNYQQTIKPILFFKFLVFTFSLSITAQIKGKVVDQQTGLAIADVTISRANSSYTYYSDSNGNFEIEENDVYKFEHIGYNTKVVDLKASNYIIIQMSPTSSELNEVVINANHIPVTLKKAVTTTSIITSKDIVTCEILLSSKSYMFVSPLPLVNGISLK